MATYDKSKDVYFLSFYIAYMIYIKDILYPLYWNDCKSHQGIFIVSVSPIAIMISYYSKCLSFRRVLVEALINVNVIHDCICRNLDTFM